ncbi:hypothetical protein PoB_005169700 [Plakobranchus ocellatus]|uniref:Uncharacterized protein n=1 Tax=Plakobranchus ocellatus TaxID=259542 RepID=A0AAV4C1H0_9GAST|nr:hypothetical protein PoB_005169700 [Plakobranchus ocellatus]
MVVSDAKCHLKCVIAFYSLKPKLAHEEREEDDALTLHAMAFAEFVAYIESFRHDPETAPVFSMPNLCGLNGNRVKDQGLQVPSRVHFGCLKEKKKLLAALPLFFFIQPR